MIHFRYTQSSVHYDNRACTANWQQGRSSKEEAVKGKQTGSKEEAAIYMHLSVRTHITVRVYTNFTHFTVRVYTNSCSAYVYALTSCADGEPSMQQKAISLQLI